MKDITRVGIREKELLPRPEPYWGPKLATNQHLGYRKITATSGSWIARLKKNGKRTYGKLGFETESFGYDQAKVKAEEWFSSELKKGSDLEKGITGEDLTVKGACEEYVRNQREQKKKPGTAHDAFKRFERTVFDDPLAKVLLSDLRKHHIQRWIDGLKMTPASLARTFTSLRAALNLAIRRGVSVEVRQAWTELELPDVPDNRRELFLDLKQRRALLKAAKELKNAKGGLRDLIEGAMLTGRRAGELTSATVAQFDHRLGTMKFIGKTSKTYPKPVPLAAPALKLFKRLTKDKPPTAHIFTRDDGLKWNHSDWDELVKDAAKEAGLPDDTVLYSLRHSWITEAISGGMTTLDVARLTGTSLQMIEKHYGKLVPDAARARLSKVKFV
jgi:integrase